MKLGGKLVVCLLGGFGVWAGNSGMADTTTTPYEEIITRNAFALKPLPPPPDPSEVNKTPPPKITLTGITTIIGKRALMETPGPAAKPGQPAGPTKLFYMLRIGEKEGDIEVLDIDEKAGSVKVRNGGQELTLTFEKDGAKLPATQAPAGLGNPGALPGVPPPPGGFPPPIKTAGMANPAFPSLPMRTVRTGTEATPAGGGYTPGGVNPAYSGSGTTLPSFTSATPLQTPTQLHDHGMTPEEQAIIMEAQRQVTQGQVAAGKLPPIPPTPITPVGSPGSLGSPNAPTPNQNTRSPLLPRPGLPPLPGGPGR